MCLNYTRYLVLVDVDAVVGVGFGGSRYERVSSGRFRRCDVVVAMVMRHQRGETRRRDVPVERAVLLPVARVAETREELRSGRVAREQSPTSSTTQMKSTEAVIGHPKGSTTV